MTESGYSGNTTMNAGKLLSRIATVFLASLGMTLVACGGGSSGSGGGGSNPPTASIILQPGSFDFGLVTEGNLGEVPARRFTIRNSGTSSYSLSSIRLEGGTPAEFGLYLIAGSTPCGSGVVALSPGASCEVEVRFAARSFGTFGTRLVVQSNDPVAPEVRSTVVGTYAEVLNVHVAVSQVKACPRELPAKVFVSVTDQGGFPIRGLGLPDFRLQELGNAAALDSAASVAHANATISLSILMDYSTSITNNPVVLESLQEAAGVLVQQLGEQDEADIAKFSNRVVFMLDDFSSDKAELLEAIAADPELPGGSLVYSSILAVMDRLKVRTKDRKAVVVLTDGQASSADSELSETIAAALEEDIPVFPVGLGSVNIVDLTQLAEETGGVFYEPAAAENLSAVYQQLANLLFDDQYVLSYLSAVPADAQASVEVFVEFVKDDKVFGGHGSKTMLACPSN
jgi:VWFA-related protein